MDILIILLLILLNGFFSMSEIAIVSFKKIRLEQYEDKYQKRIRTAIHLQEHQEDFLAAIQVGITLIGLINGFIGGSAVAKYFIPLFEWMKMSPVAAVDVSVVVSILLVTFVTIIFGELVPKTISLSNPEKTALRVAPTMYWISLAFRPIVKLLSGTTKLVDKILDIKRKESQITEDELRDMLKEAEETGVIEEEQNDIHEKVFYFADKRAKHIMTHRSEVEWIDLNLPEDQFTQQLFEVNSSKILVCDKHIENYVGALQVKEFFIHKMKNDNCMLREMLFAPLEFSDTTNAQDILETFREEQRYFGVVLNEFGELEGIVTLHDILENIVGEIPEEEEIVEPDIFVRDDNSVLVNGDAPVETLVDVIDGFEIDFEEVDYSTVAGFVLENIEKLPETGDGFDILQYHVEIVDMDRNRIDKVLVSKVHE